MVAESPNRPSRDQLETALAGFRGALHAGAAGLLREEGGRRTGLCPHTAEPGAKHPRCRPVPVVCHELDPDRLRRRASQPAAAGVGGVLRAVAGPRPRAGARVRRRAGVAATDAVRRVRGGRGSAVRRAGHAEAPRPLAGHLVPLDRLLPRRPVVDAVGRDRGPRATRYGHPGTGLAGGFPPGAPASTRTGGCWHWRCPRNGPGFCTPPWFWANIDDSGRSGSTVTYGGVERRVPHSGPCVEALWH